MKGKMNIFYDEEADYLEIFIGEPKPNYGDEVSSGVTLFKDEETDEIVGIGIFGFRKKSKNLKDIKLNLPVDLGIFYKGAC